MTWRPVDLDPLAIVMVGKPARGKTFTAGRIARYTRWLGYQSRLFNVGAYRRERLGVGQPHDFFDFRNVEARRALERLAEAAVGDLIRWVTEGGEIGILDATNGTTTRRSLVRDRIESAGIRVLFVETVCEIPQWIERNVRNTKLYSPDYSEREPEEAMRDFVQRIGHYERVYEPVAEDEGSFVRTIDMGRRMEINRIEGFLPGRLVAFLMHLHDRTRPIYLTRHGESEDNRARRIGGDSALSPAGRTYAGRLAEYVAQEIPAAPALNLWRSSLLRTKQTVAPINRPVDEWKLLDEIDGGVCDGMTYEEIERRMPVEFQARKAEKFSYRYPRGESYQDVIARLEPVVLELERQRDPVLIVAHQAVLRAIYCYLKGSPPEECPFLSIPLHSVIRITPGPYQSREEVTALGP